MSDEKYNGWTNYETWCVSLWMDNEEPSYRYWREVADDVYRDEPMRAYKGQTKRQADTEILAERLKDEHQEALPDSIATAGFAADLLQAAMDSVNWREIAEHLLDEVAENDDEEAA